MIPWSNRTHELLSMLVLVDLSAAFDCYRDWKMSLGFEGQHEIGLDHYYQIDDSLFMFTMFPLHVVGLVMEFHKVL